MSAVHKTQEIKGRCLALFPGAFRPPHRAHFEAVINLISRSDIDEVIAIITNRCRQVPGTTKALDPEIAERLWLGYLQDIEAVRVEIAESSAVRHALQYFHRVEAGDTLLLCVGKADLEQRSASLNRKINELTARTGVAASVITAPIVSPLPGRATRVRANLGQGAAGRDEFMAALPSRLTVEQRDEVWSICTQGMREMSELIERKVRALLAQNGFGEIDDLDVARKNKTDPVFQVRFKDGRRLFVKYANDTVKLADLRQPLSLKPRDRLAAERRAIRWLRANATDDVELAEVVYFDRKTKALVLTAVCPDGKPLQADLKAGVFDPAVVAKAGRFLAQCHTKIGPASPLWGDERTDLDHWRTMLALRTIDIQSERIPRQAHKCLDALQVASDAAREHQFVHLDYRPKNIRVGKGKIGVIDLELSSSIGDPAYDFGFFLGRCIFWGLSTSSGHTRAKALQAALAAYRTVIGIDWLSMGARVVAFAGAGVLHDVAVQDRDWDHRCVSRLATTGTVLLARRLAPIENADRLLTDAISGRLAGAREF